MEPCFVAGPEQYYAGLTDQLYTALVVGLDLLGIESIFGANWEAQVAQICSTKLFAGTACSALRATPVASDEFPFYAREAGVK